MSAEWPPCHSGWHNAVIGFDLLAQRSAPFEASIPELRAPVQASAGSSYEKPGCGVCNANRVSPSAEVSSLNGGCHIMVRPRAAYALEQSATSKLNWPKMAVPGRNYQADMKFLIRGRNRWT